MDFLHFLKFKFNSNSKRIVSFAIFTTTNYGKRVVTSKRTIGCSAHYLQNTSHEMYERRNGNNGVNSRMGFIHIHWTFRTACACKWSGIFPYIFLLECLPPIFIAVYSEHVEYFPANAYVICWMQFHKSTCSHNRDWSYELKPPTKNAISIPWNGTCAKIHERCNTVGHGCDCSLQLRLFLSIFFSQIIHAVFLPFFHRRVFFPLGFSL